MTARGKGILGLIAFILVLVLLVGFLSYYRDCRGRERAVRGDRTVTTNKVSGKRFQPMVDDMEVELYLAHKPRLELMDALTRECRKSERRCKEVKRDYHAAMERANLGCVLDKSKCGEQHKKEWPLTIIMILMGCLGVAALIVGLINYIRKKT
jgi:hypothetical protein